MTIRTGAGLLWVRRTSAAAILGVALFAILVQGCGDRQESSGETARRATAARKGLDGSGQMQLSPEDRCPVCAMPVTEHARFSCAIELQDGETFYFCGTGCLIRSWMHPEVYLGQPREKLSRSVVREYFEGNQIDGAKAIFVAGSDVIGPMGPALVPLEDEADVETFRKRHGGKTTFRLREMDDARWKAITGKNALPSKRP